MLTKPAQRQALNSPGPFQCQPSPTRVPGSNTHVLGTALSLQARVSPALSLHCSVSCGPQACTLRKGPTSVVRPALTPALLPLLQPRLELDLGL